VKLHDDNQYIIEGVYFGENQMPWMIADVVNMKKGFIAELQHQMLARAPVCVRVSDSALKPASAVATLSQLCDSRNRAILHSNGYT